MTSQARVSIDSHRLMQQPAPADETVSLRSVGASREERTRVARAETKRRAWWHAVTFLISFIFTTGFLALSVLLWVRPENLLALVLVGIVTSLVFVGTFAAVRMIILHKLAPGARDMQDDPGMGHHVSKSVAYGFIALVAAIVLAGLLINVATAFTL